MLSRRKAGTEPGRWAYATLLKHSISKRPTLPRQDPWSRLWSLEVQIAPVLGAASALCRRIEPRSSWLEERRAVHQHKARNDDKSCGYPSQSEWFTEQQRAHQSAKQHRGLAQGRDMGHRAEYQSVDGNAVAGVGDQPAGHATPPVALERGPHGFRPQDDGRTQRPRPVP